MADISTSHVPINAGRALAGQALDTKLFPTMTPEQIAAAHDHIVAIWWPQVCRSSRTHAMINIGMFEEAWYGEDGLLDILNPAFWKILNALGALYAKIQARYPNVEDVNAFCVRWSVDPKNDRVVLRAEGKKNSAGVTRGFRVRGPASGWLDFQAELDVLRARRDATDKTDDPEKKTLVSPQTFSASDRTIVHNVSFRPTGGAPKTSSAQRQNIAEQMTGALRDDPPADKSEDEQTSAKVSKWIAAQGDEEDQGPSIDHLDVQQPDTSTDQEVMDDTMGITPVEYDLSVNHTGVDNLSTQFTAALSKISADELSCIGGIVKTSLSEPIPGGVSTIPDIKTSSAIPNTDNVTQIEGVDEWDDWVKVDEGSDQNDEYVQYILPNGYKYTKKDAVQVARKDWFKGWYSKKV